MEVSGGDRALVTVPQSSTELVPLPQDQQLALASAGRTSAPAASVLRLEGHRGEVFAIKFNPSGAVLASASLDHDIRVFPPHPLYHLGAFFSR